MKESYPLQWPDGVPRTRIKDRKIRKVWKKTERQSIESLDDELETFGAISAVLTRKDPDDKMSAPDPSVALYFARKCEDDLSWQDALGIDNPAPTADEVREAFNRVALRYHPDKLTRDIERYLAYDKHKQNALAYVNRLSGNTPDYVITCDVYSEAKWNITAIRMTLRSFRQMERDGASTLMQQAMGAFKTKQLVAGGESAGPQTATT
jgi:hypothetical protein